MMDSLLSPRRRMLLQGIGAAVLASGCGDGTAPRAANALVFSGPTMGSTYTVKIAGAKLSLAAEEPRAALSAQPSTASWRACPPIATTPR
jgi:hypothetical protein